MMQIARISIALLFLCHIGGAAAQAVPEVEQVIFSVKDLERSEGIYTEKIGFRVRQRGDGPSADLERLWDLPPGLKAKWSLLEKPDDPESIQIRLVEFTPTSPRSRYEYREQDGGYMDVHICVPDVQAGYELLHELGFTAMSEPIPWRGGAGQAGDLGEGPRTWQEAFMHGFDGEGVTLIPGKLLNPLDCVPPPAGQFSAIRSITLAVTDIQEAYAFYHGVFGWVENVKKRYEAFGPAMEKMVGLPMGTVAKAIFLGRPNDPRIPWLSLAEFAGTERIDISERNAPPFRGFIGTTYRVAELEGFYDHVVAAGVRVVSAPLSVNEQPYGVRAFSIRGPDGVFIEIVERKGANRPGGDEG